MILLHLLGCVHSLHHSPSCQKASGQGRHQPLPSSTAPPHHRRHFQFSPPPSPELVHIILVVNARHRLSLPHAPHNTLLNPVPRRPGALPVARHLLRPPLPQPPFRDATWTRSAEQRHSSRPVVAFTRLTRRRSRCDDVRQSGVGRRPRRRAPLRSTMFDSKKTDQTNS